MVGWQKQTSGLATTSVRVVAHLLAWIAACDVALAEIVTTSASSATYANSTMIGYTLIGGFIIFAFLSSVILWIMSALRRARHANKRRATFVAMSLNNLSQGVVMVDAHSRVVFCNDRYLELYGLSRSDVKKDMIGRELVELRAKRNTLDGNSIDEYYKNAGASEGYIYELKDGRSIHSKHRQLPGGGVVSTHEDCTEQRRLSKQLATTKNFLESVIDNIPVCVAAKTVEDGRYIFANRAFERFVSKSRNQIIGNTAHELYSAETASHVLETDKIAIASPDKPVRAEFVVEDDNITRIVASNRVIARNEKNEPEFLVVLFEDVTEHRALSNDAKNARNFLERVVDNIPAALIVKRISDGQYVLANRGAETLFNRKRDEMIGHTVGEIYSHDAAKLILPRDDAAIQKGGQTIEENPLQTENGLRLFLTRRVTILGEDGQPQYLVKTDEDITERREVKSRMAHMAYHDGLTGLPNRAAFLQALTQMIDACEDTNEEFAVLSVDIDRLKEINDVFGHQTCDKLLIEVGRRFDAAARGGFLARLSGDEFGLIIDGKQPEAAKKLAAQLSRAMQEEFKIDDRSVRIGVTTGISVFPRDGHAAESLLANADAALFRAKEKSRGSVYLFDAEMDRQLRDRRAMHQELAMAIRRGELSLHYQPQAKARRHVDSSDIIGFEALARWHHPTRGYVQPSDFIPLAEESGLIVEMGEWILREACHEAASWPKHLQLAVNLSPAQFMHGDLVGLVHSILLESGLTPDRLELEITEGVLIDDFDRGLSLLRRLKALGVRISMDDFGSGYSSLTYLQAFPFDKIKIDRAFVMNLGRNKQSAAIIRAMISLCHGLDIPIVAEGVETQEQLSFLAAEGCDHVQGYFLGYPAPIGKYADCVGRAADSAVERKTG